MSDLSWPESGERIPCFYDMKLGLQFCRLDGRNWQWRFTGLWMGKVDPAWVRLHAQ